MPCSRTWRGAPPEAGRTQSVSPSVTCVTMPSKSPAAASRGRASSRLAPARASKDAMRSGKVVEGAVVLLDRPAVAVQQPDSCCGLDLPDASDGGARLFCRALDRVALRGGRSEDELTVVAPGEYIFQLPLRIQPALGRHQAGGDLCLNRRAHARLPQHVAQV